MANSPKLTRQVSISSSKPLPDRIILPPLSMSVDKAIRAAQAFKTYEILKDVNFLDEMVQLIYSLG
jgi:hypothetical protein